MEAIAHRVDAEKQRQVGYCVIEVANRAVYIAVEIANLQTSMVNIIIFGEFAYNTETLASSSAVSSVVAGASMLTNP